MTPAEIASDWSAVTGKKAAAVVADVKPWKAQLVSYGLTEHLAEEMYENMRLMAEFGYFGGAPLEESQKVSSSLASDIKGEANMWIDSG